jgi:hypothetical protein
MKRETMRNFRKRLSGTDSPATSRVGDAACNSLHCGDTVIDVRDPRHFGRVERIHWGTATVKWDMTGWLSNHPVENLRKHGENR